MKKSRKKILLSSIAMLLVALVALGSATFAWFTVNRVVTADTINVKAAVADGLVIDNKQTPTWTERAVSFDSTYVTLNPVSIDVPATDGGNTATLGTPYFANDVQDDGHDGKGIASEFQASALPTGNKDGQDLTFNNNNYVAAYTVAVKSSGAAISRGVKAAISATGTTNKDGKTFAKAALVKGGKVIGFYTDEQYTPIVNNSGTIGEKSGTVAEANQSNITAMTSVPAKASAAEEFTLYVWYEGNDQHCTDARQTFETSFTLTFTLDNA